MYILMARLRLSFQFVRNPKRTVMWFDCVVERRVPRL
jgi:hypothetical protein